MSGQLALDHAPGPVVDPDIKRANLLAKRVTEGMRTLDAAGRSRVFEALADEFCLGCGGLAAGCVCGGRKR